MTTIDVTLTYNDESNPFGIQPRCPLHKLISNVQNYYGSIIDTIYVTSNAMQEPRLIYDIKTASIGLTQKYLIEDYKIKHKDYIIVQGHKVDVNAPDHDLDKYNANHPNKDMIAATEIIIRYKDNDYAKIVISKFATTLSLKTIISQTRQFIPNSIELLYDEKVLDDHTIIHSVLKNGNNYLTLRATYLPINILGKDINFAENVGLKVYPDCAICFEKNDSVSMYKCGHSNVCSGCRVKYIEQNCPMCVNIDK